MLTGKIPSRTAPSFTPSVTLQAFGVVSACFGPLDMGFFDRVRNVASKPWFHPWLSASEADGKTSMVPNAQFLVRFSTRSLGCFCISRFDGLNGLHHLYRYDQHNGFFIDVDSDGVFESLDAIIALNPVLRMPCTDSPVSWIYQQL